MSDKNSSRSHLAKGKSAGQQEIISFLQQLDSHSGDHRTINTMVDHILIQNFPVIRFTNEFWTSKQRQACSLHEISYRACYKPQLPHFFVQRLTRPGDVVYDPFSGRGTTILEAALLERNVIANDINPLSEILSRPRLSPPLASDVNDRLSRIPLDPTVSSEYDLSMFYDKDTLAEIISLKQYLQNKKESGEEDGIDRWIRMVATNRLTGHSPGFFSVYTLPPNQAVSAERQVKINLKYNQTPSYRNTHAIILKKTKSLLRAVTPQQLNVLQVIAPRAQFLTEDSRTTPSIPSDALQLIVTSPPFLDVVKYTQDNWLRCWFNSIELETITRRITQLRNIGDWSSFIKTVFEELFRVIRSGGWIAFEVGEVRQGTIHLDEIVVPLGLDVGFESRGVLINAQKFTKTSNIWGVDNNAKGTNSNRVVIFQKP